MKPFVLLLLFILLIPMKLLAQTDQSISITNDEGNNRLVFVGQGEWLDEQVDQAGVLNSIIFISEILQIPQFYIRQSGDLNRAIILQLPVEETSSDSTSTKNRIEVIQKGNGNSATVIQN